MDDVSTLRRWAMLAASTLAQAAAAVMMHGPAFLIPVLHDREGLSLAEAGLVAAAPTVGVMLTLVAWGALTDRVGERRVLLTGLTATAVAGVVSVLVDGLVPIALALLLAGGAAASTNAASGRVVVGWFPPQRRGLAMGIRQMAQPVGVGVAAVSIAVVADRSGIQAALLVPTIACALAALVVAAVVLDPPRPARVAGDAPNPYRENGYLARIHGVSVLLVVPQFVVWTFALVWLVQDRDWSPAAAGGLVAGAQVAGALGRIAAGHLSDVVASRMRPLRWVAVAAAVTMGLLGAAAGQELAIAVPLVVLATVLTVADNGLAFTAVAERAGPFWSGRALGLQNTAQFVTASAVPPVAGLAVTHLGYAAAFGVAALFPVLAAPLVPVGEERELS
ncbi:MFS transporter [Nocardioides lianchengensis]|uniref:Sugar phosphate permease n=1 Tax=Nocardioides lianchengensis TaxID=1045774 RepID=A0A1G7AEJ5_9ACTN|nr:MFS transporter [Nocardioides lianchengensis]NYG13609.1 sugar phosphate permease [Nocardioides lianchengensis]SDE13241.1 Sugar phosphate permease [Nocardioides lianchengensis]